MLLQQVLSIMFFFNADFQVRFFQEEVLASEIASGVVLTVELLANRPLNATGVVRVTTQDGTALGNPLHANNAVGYLFIMIPHTFNRICSFVFFP